MQAVHPKEVGVDAGRVEHLFRAIEKKITEGWLFGGAFLLARRGKIVAARGVGQTEPEKGRAAKVDDIFCLFSTTKPITATMLLMKADQGDVQLYEKVSAYIPEFGAAGKRHITVAQVLTHTAGFPTMPIDWKLAQWAEWTTSHNLPVYVPSPLEYEPGTAVHFTMRSLAHGFWLKLPAGRWWTRSFAQMCQEDLYTPWVMKDSHMGVLARYASAPGASSSSGPRRSTLSHGIP